MKLLCRGLLSLSLLAFLVSCGKENKSGQSTYPYSNPYTQGYTPGVPVNSPYHLPNGLPVNKIIEENPCVNQGYMGMPGMPPGMTPNNLHRIPIQIPLTGFPATINPGEIYAGVTSYGDVAVMVGTNVGQPPLFVGYLCPRSFAPQGQGQLMGIKIGAYSKCQFKPITAATVVLPGGSAAEFRMLDFGSSRRMPFSFCLP